MEWIFDGIGTEIVIFIIGILCGVGGNKLYDKRKLSQKAGNGSFQIQTSDTIMGDKEIEGDIVHGDKIIINSPDALDIRNFMSYSNTQIEDVINKGNDATRRKWGLELILNNREEYLIQKCIESISNNSEKYNLLVSLADRQFSNTEHFQSILSSISNDLYKYKLIELFIAKNEKEHIKKVFKEIANNKYIEDSLKAIWKYDNTLFSDLYDGGSCFSNMSYKNKMTKWLENSV